MFEEAIERLAREDKARSRLRIDDGEKREKEAASVEAHHRHSEFLNSLTAALLRIYDLDIEPGAPALPEIDIDRYQREYPLLTADQARKGAVTKFVAQYRLEKADRWEVCVQFAQRLLLYWRKFSRTGRRDRTIDPVILDASAEGIKSPSEVAENSLQAILNDSTRTDLDRFWAAVMVWTYREPNKAQGELALRVFDELWPRMRAIIQEKLRNDALDDQEQRLIMEWVSILARENRDSDNKPRSKGEVALVLEMSRQADLNRKLKSLCAYLRSLGADNPLVVARAIVERISRKLKEDAFDVTCAPLSDFIAIHKKLVRLLTAIPVDAIPSQIAEKQRNDLRQAANDLSAVLSAGGKEGFPNWLRRAVRLLAHTMVAVLR